MKTIDIFKEHGIDYEKDYECDIHRENKRICLFMGSQGKTIVELWCASCIREELK